MSELEKAQRLARGAAADVASLRFSLALRDLQSAPRPPRAPLEGVAMLDAEISELQEAHASEVRARRF
ncbi:MAG TPA: hypothetical protein VGF15_03455 [Solirubrobacteraceae bacterium]|jgi:hypothetical protein